MPNSAGQLLRNSCYMSAAGAGQPITKDAGQEVRAGLKGKANEDYGLTHGPLLAKGHCPNGSHQEASPCLLSGLGLGGLSGRSVGDPAASVAYGLQEAKLVMPGRRHRLLNRGEELC